MLSLLSGFLVSFSGFVLVYLFHPSGLLKKLCRDPWKPPPWSLECWQRGSPGRGLQSHHSHYPGLLSHLSPVPGSLSFSPVAQRTTARGATASEGSIWMMGTCSHGATRGALRIEVATTFSFYEVYIVSLMCSHIDTPIFSATQYLLHQEHVMGFI